MNLELKVRKQFGLFLWIILFVVYFSGCQQPAAAAVVPKTDTGVISYWPTKRVNPQMYYAIWHVSVKYKPSQKDSTKNTLSSDTSYSVKLSDTTSDGKGGQIRDTLHHSI